VGKGELPLSGKKRAFWGDFGGLGEDEVF